MDYEYLALSLANLSSIPVRLYREGKFAGIYHPNKFKPDLAMIEEPNIFKSTKSVSYYMTADFLVYGLFRVKDTPVSMVVGPVPQMPVSRRTAQNILLSIGESPARHAELQQYLSSIPNYPLNSFLQILCSFSYAINQEKLSVSDLILQEVEPPELLPKQSLFQDSSDIRHSTYGLEQELLATIEYGRPDVLEQMYQLPPTGNPGRMAQDAIRQQKNIVIVTATLSSRAAIRGGMDVESALTLSDLYIQKAEQINEYEGLALLSKQLTLDFAHRTAALRCGDSNRKLIHSLRQYILHHINERISTEELAQFVGMSRTYLASLFKEATGYGLSEYITKIKIDEAKRLLKATDKPLRAISDHLGFSSQSHFQRVFKNIVGMTPLEYRRGNTSSGA